MIYFGNFNERERKISAKQYMMTGETSNRNIIFIKLNQVNTIKSSDVSLALMLG